MILKKVVSSLLGFTGTINRHVRKILGWIMNIPKPEDPRGMEIKREGSDHALPVVYGERMVGGIVVHDWVTDSVTGISGIEQHDRKNAYLHQIIAFCHGAVHSIDALYFNGEHENAQQYQGKYAAYRMNGSDTQNAITSAVNNIGNWNDSMRGRNVAYIYLVLYQDENQTIWRGEPEVQAVIRGRTLYDPRTSATSYSDNPALAALDYLLNPIYGRGLNANRIDMAAFAAAANFCDEGTSSTVSYTICEPSFSPQEAPVCRQETRTINTPRYRIDALINTEATVFNNYRELLQVFRAYPRRPNGMVSLHVETVAPESFPVFDDFELVGSIKYQLGGQRDRYNRFKIRFPNKLNRYERDEFTYPTKDDPLYQQWLDEDNGKELLGELELNTISETSYAAQNAEIAAKASRLSGVMATTLPPRARLLEPGDIIGINSDLYGWTAKQFRIQSIGETTTGAFEVELREHEDAVYTWSGSSWDEQVGGSWLGNPAQPDAPTNLQIFPDPTLASGGRLTWQSVNDAFVREYEVVISQGGDVVFDNRTRGTAFDLPLLDVGEYTVQVFSVTTLGYRSEPATLIFNLEIPAAPTDLGLSSRNFEVTSEPVLAGRGLGTQFEFDIVEGDGDGYSPEHKAQGTSAVFAGLTPGTMYTVFVRTINPLGTSEWVSESITTAVDPSQIIELVEDLLADSPIFDDVIDELRDRVEGVRDRITTTRETFIDNINDILDNAFETKERVTGIQRVDEDIRTETEQRITQGQQITVALEDEVATRSAQITNVNQAIADEAGARATNVNQLNARVDTVDSEVEAVSTFAQNVDARVDGAVQATNLLEARVVDVETGQSATATLLQNAGLQADGSTNATTAILNQINDPVTGLQANSDLLLDVIQDPFGKSSALADLNTDVNSLSGEVASANLTLESIYDATNDELIARGALVADAGGRIAGIVLESGKGPSTIEMQGDVMRWLRANGSIAVQYDTQVDDFVFDGRIVADSGRVGGWQLENGSLFRESGGFRIAELDSNVPQLIFRSATDGVRNAQISAQALIAGRESEGENYLVWTRSSGLRLSGTIDVVNNGQRIIISPSGSYSIWIGPNGVTPTDLNGDFWIKNNADGFIRGDFFKGQIIESRHGSGSGTTLPVVATASGHVSAGNTVEISGAVSLYGTGPGSLVGQQRTVTITARRGSTVVGTRSVTMVGQLDEGVNVAVFSANASFDIVDTGNSAQTYNYSVTASGSLGFTISTNINFKTFENKVG